MIELRKAIQAILKDVHPRTWYGMAPKSAKFPYLVYTLSSFDQGEGFVFINLDIDCWDNTDDTTEQEALLKSVHRAIHSKVIKTDDFAVALYADRQMSIIDNEPTIKRRMNTYQGRLYKRGENTCI